MPQKERKKDKSILKQPEGKEIMKQFYRFIKKLKKQWIVFCIFVILFSYVLGYGIVYRVGDYIPTIGWVCPIMYYPVNYFRCHNDFLYDFTEFTYSFFRGKRTIEERSKEIGFHREWYKMGELGNYYYTYHNGEKTGEYHFYGNGNPQMILIDSEGKFELSFFYRNGNCALSRKNGIGKAFWSNKHLFAQWTFGDFSKPIDGFMPIIHNDNKKQLRIKEFKNGELINEYTDLSPFGGTHLLINDYLKCVSP